MDIFIGNLPANGKLIALEEMLGGLSARSRFERRLGFDGIDKNYHYLVVTTASDAEGLALIERFDGLMFEGNRLTARQYIQRGQGAGTAGEWDGVERRVNRAASE